MSLRLWQKKDQTNPKLEVVGLPPVYDGRLDNGAIIRAIHFSLPQ
jgi:hypothetical protein